MPYDPEAFAEMVVLTIKAALAPVLVRLAVSEQSNRELTARVLELTALRDRLTTVETKAALTGQSMSTAEVELVLRNHLDPLASRLATVETKAAAPPPLASPPSTISMSDIEIVVRDRLDPLVSRMTESEQVQQVQQVELNARALDCKGLRDRVNTIETKAPVAVELPTLPSPAELELSIRDRIEPVTKQVATLSERIAVLEVRAPIPGPPGKDGASGKDGADGVGFDDLDVAFDGDRTIELKFARGTRTKSWPIVLPFQKQQGVYVEGESYVVGDVVTWAGSQWHCNEATTAKPGDGLKAWTLIVKRGRDGKDGRDAVTTPVVSVGRS